MTAFDKKVNQIAARHRWNIEKQARAAVPCYIIAAPTYEDTGKIVAVVAPVQGCFCCLPKGSDSSLNGISLQW